MSRDLQLYLEDIELSCQKVIRYVDGMDFETFRKDDRTYDAVIRNLEIIGEAVKNLPEVFRIRFPDIEWRAMGALRNIVAHEYFGVKDEIIWDVVAHKIPVLLNQIKHVLKSLE